MRKRLSTQKRKAARPKLKKKPVRKPTKRVAKRPPTDPNKAAFAALQELLGSDVMGEAVAKGKNPLAFALGRRGGLKGGAKRREWPEDKLTASVKHAAQERWRQYRERKAKEQ